MPNLYIFRKQKRAFLRCGSECQISNTFFRRISSRLFFVLDANVILDTNKSSKLSWAGKDLNFPFFSFVDIHHIYNSFDLTVLNVFFPVRAFAQSQKLRLAYFPPRIYCR